jgi:hypothetical protein
MTFVYKEPSESLLIKLSELYIKYINVKQISSDEINPVSYVNSRTKTNKFNLLFDDIAENINLSNIDNLKSIIFTCISYKQRYINGLKELLEKDKKYFETVKDYKDERPKKLFSTKIELFEHLISFVGTFTYSLTTSAEECKTNYYTALITHLEKIKDIVKDRAIPLIYEHIKSDISQIINAQNIEKIKENNLVLLEDKYAVSKQLSKELEEHINTMLEIPEDITDDKKYLLSQLENKYKEFLFITNRYFTQEIKNKIKKSVIELVFAEIKIQKRLNLKKPLLVTNTLTEFFAI